MSISDRAKVRAWVDAPRISEDLFDAAWAAAERYVSERVTLPEGMPEGGGPADLVQAVNLLTARYLARRNSPDGMVGMGELGPARVTIADRDVERLIDPWRSIAVA